MNISAEKFSCKRGELTIRGGFYRPQGENLPIAIVSHEFMTNGKRVSHYAKLMAEKGYVAFYFDFCGGCVAIGKSDGKSKDMSVLTEAEDLLSVIGYAKSLPFTDEKRIVLMGCSQGGFVSALVAARLKSEIEKLILFYPALCIPDDARRGKMLLAKFDPADIPEKINCGPMILGRCYMADVIDMDPFEEISGYTGDVFIVHGTKDSIVDISYSERAVEAYEKRDSGTVQLKTVEGGGHIFLSEHDKIARKYILEFLE